MRFIKVWSYQCAKALTLQLNESHVKRGLYYFGFQVAIGSIVKGGLLLLAALLLGIFIPTVALVIVFSSLRVIAGGYHMDTYGKCFSISLALFIPFAAIAQYTAILWSFQSLAILISFSTVFALAILQKWAPSDTPNRPITKPEEIKKFRTLSIIYVFVWLAVMVLLMAYKQNLYIVAGCFGLILEAFIITPLAHRIFDNLSEKIDKIIK